MRVTYLIICRQDLWILEMKGEFKTYHEKESYARTQRFWKVLSNGETKDQLILYDQRR